jgi:hypothetical protein
MSLGSCWDCGRRRSQALDEFRHVLQCAAVILVVVKELELGIRASVKKCRCWTEWTDNQIRASLAMAVSV